MGAYTVYTAHPAPPHRPLPISWPICWYSFSRYFIDHKRCFVCINKLENLLRTNRQRIQNLRPLLSPWIVGVSGPIFSHEFQSEFQKYNIISSIYSFTSHQRHPTLVITQCGNFSNNFPTLCEGSYLILPNQF